MKIIRHNNSKKYLIILFTLALTSFSAYGQLERSLFYLPILPNARTVNPAIIPSYKLYVGIPFVSSVKTGFDNNFKHEDLFIKKGDSLYLDRDHILNRIDDETKGNINLMDEVFAVGFKLKKNYFHFRIAEMMNTNFSIGKEFFRFVLYGNGSDHYLGNTVTFDKNSFNLTYYREYSLGYTRQITDKLNLGVNLKYLQGIANISTEDMEASLYTDPNDFTLSAQTNIRINTSIPWKEGSGFQPADVFTVTGNSGFAFDIGGQYLLNNKWSFSASVLDLGNIKWNNNLKNFKTKDPDKMVSFSGFDLDDFLEDGGLDRDHINDVLDSLSNELGIVETEESYNTKIPTSITANANYNLGTNNRFSGVFGIQFLEDWSWPTFSLAYTRYFTRDVNMMLSYTVTPNSFFNLGGGFAANIGPAQFYLVAENFMASFALSKAELLQIRFGINLVFGKTWKKEKKKKKGEEKPVDENNS